LIDGVTDTGHKFSPVSVGFCSSNDVNAAVEGTELLLKEHLEKKKRNSLSVFASQ
jgi:hypothetical protein